MASIFNTDAQTDVNRYWRGINTNNIEIRHDPSDISTISTSDLFSTTVNIPATAVRWDNVSNITLNTGSGNTYVWEDTASAIRNAVEAAMRLEYMTNVKPVAETPPDMKEFDRLLEDLD